jgi:hypothetical protein
MLPSLRRLPRVGFLLKYEKRWIDLGLGTVSL